MEGPVHYPLIPTLGPWPQYGSGTLITHEGSISLWNCSEDTIMSTALHSFIKIINFTLSIFVLLSPWSRNSFKYSCILTGSGNSINFVYKHKSLIFMNTFSVWLIIFLQYFMLHLQIFLNLFAHLEDSLFVNDIINHLTYYMRVVWGVFWAYEFWCWETWVCVQYYHVLVIWHWPHLKWW